MVATTLTVLMLLAAGFYPHFEPGDSCVRALHDLRTKERMEIISTVTQDQNLVYTLGDQHHRRGSKTAILVCEPTPVVEEDEGGSEEPST